MSIVNAKKEIENSFLWDGKKVLRGFIFFDGWPEIMIKRKQFTLQHN